MFIPAIKKNGVQSSAGKQVQLETAMLSELSQKDKRYIFPHLGLSIQAMKVDVKLSREQKELMGRGSRI